MPPSGSATPVAYQVAGNRASVAGVANAAAIVDIHLLLNTAPTAVSTSPLRLRYDELYGFDDGYLLNNGARISRERTWAP